MTTAITLTLSPHVLGATRGAVRVALKKRRRELAKGFTPKPGRANLTEAKVRLLAEAEAALTAALGDAG